MKMFMKCKDCGKFIKLNVEGIRSGDPEAKTWIMVETEEEATDDPGMVGGEDHSMPMLMYVNREYGCSSFSPVGSKEEEEESERLKIANAGVYGTPGVHKREHHKVKIGITGHRGVSKPMVASTIAAIGDANIDVSDLDYYTSPKSFKGKGSSRGYYREHCTKLASRPPKHYGKHNTGRNNKGRRRG